MTCHSLLAWLLKVGIVHCSIEGEVRHLARCGANRSPVKGGELPLVARRYEGIKVPKNFTKI
jgi:hypothetical protein